MACKLAFHGNDIINIYRLIDKEHVAMLIQESDQIFAGRNILSTLYTGTVVQDMEALQDRIRMIIYIFIFFQQTRDDFFSFFHPFGRRNLVVHGIFDFAVSSDLVRYNVSRQYNTRTVKTLAETNHYNVFTDDDRDKILSVLEPSRNIYDLAIQFMFCLCCRIGEIRALHWEDIADDDSFIVIHREIVSRADENGNNHYVEMNHTKTGHDSGVRVLPLNDRAQNILQKIRDTYGSNTTYVFTSKNGKFIYETPFADHLRAACEKAGVQYRSSHKIRFWAASSLASKGASVQDLMSIGGWSNTETAMRYIRLNSVGKRTKQLFNEAVR